MSVRETARKQYLRLVDGAAAQLADLARPAEGWLVSLRKALGMSGADVARRMGVTRSAVYQAERNERDGAITLAQMEKLASALGGRFVYAIVPEGSVDAVLQAQAYNKAEARIRRASAQMALESQALPEGETRRRIAELARELVRDRPSDFWQTR
ncbi:mobile mystery protein A [Kiloniella laminariae]|uniref:Mobile mystery protein A n=1 Tax=Kiloniella laminariae TaxID=454162 RepID=A0ABT4LFE7_9PROT|nr:mobile mystery protein A [Kiloniella laminariae]MCZ4279833.1 mobile mystery protein A [Kiloniella laminariae]